MQFVTIDFLLLNDCSNCYEYFLVVTDFFTRYTQAYPTRSKVSRTAAKRIFNHFILRFGMPNHFFHDRDKQFGNMFLHQLTKLFSGVKQLRTIPYYRQTNGAVESKKFTICFILKTLTDKQNTPFPI